MLILIRKKIQFKIKSQLAKDQVTDLLKKRKDRITNICERDCFQLTQQKCIVKNMHGKC